MYGVLHVDNEAHTASLIPLKDLDNIPVIVEPLDPYKLHGVRVSAWCCASSTVSM